jgi:hypothetical protein
LGCGNKGFLFLLVALVLIPLSLAARDPSEIDMLSVDPQNAGKGGMAILSGFGQFFLNPAYGLANKRYEVGAAYLFPTSFSLALSDSKKAKFAGGLLYDRHETFNTFKTNLAFPLHKSVFFGINTNYYSGRMYNLGNRKIESTTFDFGFAGLLWDFIYWGVAITDPFPVRGDNLPMKFNSSLEFDIFKKYLFLNAGVAYHIDKKEESIIETAADGTEVKKDWRSFLKYTDLAVGAEFRYKIFIASAGFNSSAYSRKFVIDEVLKTFGIGFYEPAKYGVYGGFYFKKDYYSFSVNLVWEPF